MYNTNSFSLSEYLEICTGCDLYKCKEKTEGPFPEYIQNTSFNLQQTPSVQKAILGVVLSLHVVSELKDHLNSGPRNNFVSFTLGLLQSLSPLNFGQYIIILFGFNEIKQYICFVSLMVGEVSKTPFYWEYLFFKL